MRKTLTIFLVLSFSAIFAQDLSLGLLVNDLTDRPMQDVPKPAYLGAFTDPSFGTTIRRITNAGADNVIKPMYSTVQAWNTDESMMIVYNQSLGVHQLLHGTNYNYIKDIIINEDDIEQLFWDFDDPDQLYYLERSSDDLIRYDVVNETGVVLANLDDITGCNGNISLGNDVQMMSWDSDVIGFRCDNDEAYYYRISTGTVTEFTVSSVSYTAPMPGPSGDLFYHRSNVYAGNGNLSASLNESSTEHSSMGRLTNGNDGYFAIAFAQGPNGGCIGDIIAHDLISGTCFPLISQSQGYEYPQSGTHISALSHNNTEGGWLAASMMGYDQDGQSLLDQELVIAKADAGNVKVCRIGHHRSDEDDWDYWGEPHAVISPSGTRVLFGSDWSGDDDGHSIDCYVVELPAYANSALPVELVSFTEQVQGCEVKLAWQTASEQDNDHFILQRSADGSRYTDLDQIEGSGTTSNTQSYTFTDLPGTGQWYYRLQQLDLDGSKTQSPILASRVQCENKAVIANNLTQDYCQLHFTAEKDRRATIFIYDQLGGLIEIKTVEASRGANNVQVNVQDFLPGTYLLHLENGHQRDVFKLVKW